ncbi:MAG: UDP-3-O-(3-hydroxymyristoyl)glucosamine N-acyltransferase [Pirellulales bacterium]|nr:UDP-3-O-(3-hydroxymyristoyl)glucosamine N-acyltransferase [Pirellulales bacterium]
MHATLAELAALVGGRLVGDGGVVIRGAAPLSDAGPGDITLIDRAERISVLSGIRAAAVVMPNWVPVNGLPAIQVDDVHRAFTVIVSRFRPVRTSGRIGVSPLAVVSAKARIGNDVDIYPYATIADDVQIGDGSTIHSGVHILPGTKIGENVTIFPNCVLYENTVVGPRCVIHACTVIGAYGFGYHCHDGAHHLSAQLGNVVLGADVEIGSSTTIDRGTYGSTIIGDGTKIDNQVIIAHNCHIGRHNLLCAQVGIAGSTTTGDYVTMAGQVGIRDHVRIGSGAVLGAMAGVMNDVPENARMVGIPATPEREQMVKLASLGKLPEMRRQLKHLQATVERLTRQLAEMQIDGVASGDSRETQQAKT